jgi:hypothetical protein
MKITDGTHSLESAGIQPVLAGDTERLLPDSCSISVFWSGCCGTAGLGEPSYLPPVERPGLHCIHARTEKLR